MSESLVFVLPDGRSAQISPPSARLICDRLWDLRITPGAAQAAARISEALHTHPLYWRDVAFSEREVPPLLEASEVTPPVWISPAPTSRWASRTAFEHVFSTFATASSTP